MLALFDKILMQIELATARIAGLVIFILMILVTTDVVLRKLFNSPIRGQLDFTTMAMIAFSVLCISHCYRQSGHVRMDLLIRMTSGRVYWSTHLLVTVAALLTISVILPGTWAHFLRAYEFGDTTFGVGLSTWPSKLAVPVGFGVLWLRLVLELWVFGRLVIDPDAEPIGVPMAPDPLNEMDA